MYQTAFIATHPKQALGFTLIELSIVLVIIGLIVGGVLVGQDLIEAAKLRSQLSQVEQIKTAANTFRLKYNCLPGDCLQAETYFGASETNNGNGDKQIAFNTEDGYVWEHLSLAQLIAGDFTGRTGASAPTASPQSHIESAYSEQSGIHYFYQGAGGSTYQQGAYTHVLQIGSWSGNNFSGPLMSPIHAKSIDDKVDDGLPYSGRVLVIKGYVSATGWASGCVNKDAYQSPPITWLLSSTAKDCAIIFKQ